MRDLVFVDGPYGLNKYPGDEIRTTSSRELYRRIFQRAAEHSAHLIVFGTFDSLAWVHEVCRPTDSPLLFRRDVIWHKPDWTAGGNSTWAPRHEVFLHYARSAAAFNLDAIRVPYGERAQSGVKMKGGKEVGWQPNPLGARCPDVVPFTSDRLSNKVEGRTQANKHACVKPAALLEMIVKACSPDGGTVHEPFRGSDSLEQACQRLGRVYVGYANARDY